MWEHFRQNKPNLRGVCVWHRRAGKDLLSINLCVTKMVERVGTYWHLLPTYRQGRSIVWNGFTKEGRAFLDHFPNELIANKLNNEMRIHLKNGSIYQVVGTDDVNLLVGTNPVGCIFSEYSLHDPRAWQFISPILAENGGWALFIMTPRGKNHGHKLWQMAQASPDWFSELLHAGDDGTKREDGTPVIPDSLIKKEIAEGMPQEVADQEFYCSFEAPLVGSYYGAQMDQAKEEGRICNVPYDPLIPVDTYWDIGVRDSTSIIFCQSHKLEHRIIDYYETSGEPLEHYKRTLQERRYIYGVHFAPWDVNIREFTSGNTILEAARRMGIQFRVTPQMKVLDGIENVRRILRACWFDQKKCSQLLESLKSYRKEWDEKNQCYKNNPIHDWSSHAADAMRVLAWNAGKRLKRENKKQHTAIDDYAYI